ncbi:unnamed protein product [Arabidopsis halleri]
MDICENVSSSFWQHIVKFRCEEKKYEKEQQLFEYEKGGKLETRLHGVKQERSLKFELNPDEYIKSVEATYDKPDFWTSNNFFRNVVITSLTFETWKGRTSFSGYKGGKKFKLEQKGRKLVGFHGKEGSAIDALGAYFAPIPTPTPIIPAKKLPAIGGNDGMMVSTMV